VEGGTLNRPGVLGGVGICGFSVLVNFVSDGPPAVVRANNHNINELLPRGSLAIRELDFQGWGDVRRLQGSQQLRKRLLLGIGMKCEGAEEGDLQKSEAKRAKG
jgi:hypothetical protein